MQYFIPHKAIPALICRQQAMVLTRGQSLRDPHRHGEGLQLQPQQLAAAGKCMLLDDFRGGYSTICYYRYWIYLDILVVVILG